MIKPPYHNPFKDINGGGGYNDDEPPIAQFT